MESKQKSTIKLLLVITICTAYIFSFSHFGVLAYDTFVNKKESFDEGTTIGNVDVSGKMKAEAVDLVNEQINNWMNETVIHIQFKEKSTTLNKKLINFKVEDTVSKVIQGTENKLIVEIKSIDSILSSVSQALSPSDFNIEKLNSDIVKKVSMLQGGEVKIKLPKYLHDEKLNDDNRISQVTLNTNISENDRAYITKNLNEIEIAPLSQFSLISKIKELGIKQVSPDVLNIIATGINQVILPTNFTIYERHTSEELPSYATLGYEARVNVEKNIDLVFNNPNDLSYKLAFEWKNSSLVVSLKGKDFFYKYKIVKKRKKIIEPKIIVQFNPQLRLGQKIVENAGKDGLFIKVYRATYNEFGEKINNELISEDFYPPIHKVEVHPLILEKESDESNSTDDNGTDTNTDDNPPPADDENNDNNDDMWGNPDEEPKG